MRVKCDDKKGWEEPGRVVEQCASCSCIVETPSGQRRCYCCHLKVVAECGDDGRSNIVPDLPVPEDGASVPLPVPEAETPASPAEWPRADPRADPALYTTREG